MDRETDEKGAHFGLFFLALFFVVVAWLLNIAILLRNEDRGVYGDMFGAVNSVFSGFAFAGVVYAIVLQRYEVAISREELLRTKEIMEHQAAAIVEQNAATMRKSFEDTFFQMLAMHQEILTSIDLYSKGTDVTTSGRDVFSAMLRRLKESSWEYQRFYRSNGQELGHYYRWLYNLLKYIDMSAPAGTDRRFYTNLVRAQMSDREVALLYFNALSEHGKKIKPFVVEYGLLKHLKENDLTNSGAIKSDYDASAFGVDNRHPHWLID
ncbi:putative phage abortive infection protein [uncultured Roseobacter sp.]|uniref:putative phage abortive infection protein n=1 Tax=uncultured Roseobacter sp. TaxID=114847 RepID=UPI0026367499|nr:putative phage abortive infection protein [uncultured Roseobacter sp.]